MSRLAESPDILLYVHHLQDVWPPYLTEDASLEEPAGEISAKSCDLRQSPHPYSRAIHADHRGYSGHPDASFPTLQNGFQ